MCVCVYNFLNIAAFHHFASKFEVSTITKVNSYISVANIELIPKYRKKSLSIKQRFIDKIILKKKDILSLFAT